MTFHIFLISFISFSLLSPVSLRAQVGTSSPTAPQLGTPFGTPPPTTGTTGSSTTIRITTDDDPVPVDPTIRPTTSEMIVVTQPTTTTPSTPVTLPGTVIVDDPSHIPWLGLEADPKLEEEPSDEKESTPTDDPRSVISTPTPATDVIIPGSEKVVITAEETPLPPPASSCDNEGDPCDDGDPCTIGDRCAKNVCYGGPPPSDGDSCTQDSCDSQTGRTTFTLIGACSALDPACNPDSCQWKTLACNLSCPGTITAGNKVDVVITATDGLPFMDYDCTESSSNVLSNLTHSSTLDSLTHFSSVEASGASTSSTGSSASTPSSSSINQPISTDTSSLPNINTTSLDSGSSMNSAVYTTDTLFNDTTISCTITSQGGESDPCSCTILESSCGISAQQADGSKEVLVGAPATARLTHASSSALCTYNGQPVSSGSSLTIDTSDSGTKTISVNCTGGGSSYSCSDTITVQPICHEILGADFSPTVGQSLSFRPNVEGANSCEVTFNGGPAHPLDATMLANETKVPYQFNSTDPVRIRITCWGNDGTSTICPTIDVTPNSPIACGNGVIETGEECDDGNPSNNDECTTGCKKAFCSDGFFQPSVGEECDDGNMKDADGCSSQCIEEPTCETFGPTSVRLYYGESVPVTITGRHGTLGWVENPTQTPPIQVSNGPVISQTTVTLNCSEQTAGSNIPLQVYVTRNETGSYRAYCPGTLLWDCRSACGNGQINGTEECDGTDFGGQSCTSLGFTAGSLGCNDCALDTSGCTQEETPPQTSEPPPPPPATAPPVDACAQYLVGSQEYECCRNPNSTFCMGCLTAQQVNYFNMCLAEKDPSFSLFSIQGNQVLLTSLDGNRTSSTKLCDCPSPQPVTAAPTCNVDLMDQPAYLPCFHADQIQELVNKGYQINQSTPGGAYQVEVSMTEEECRQVGGQSSTNSSGSVCSFMKEECRCEENLPSSPSVTPPEEEPLPPSEPAPSSTTGTPSTPDPTTGGTTGGPSSPDPTTGGTTGTSGDSTTGSPVEPPQDTSTTGDTTGGSTTGTPPSSSDTTTSTTGVPTEPPPSADTTSTTGTSSTSTTTTGSTTGSTSTTTTSTSSTSTTGTSPAAPVTPPSSRPAAPESTPASEPTPSDPLDVLSAHNMPVCICRWGDKEAVCLHTGEKIPLAEICEPSLARSAIISKDAHDLFQLANSCSKHPTPECRGELMEKMSSHLLSEKERNQIYQIFAMRVHTPIARVDAEETPQEMGASVQAMSFEEMKEEVRSRNIEMTSDGVRINNPQALQVFDGVTTTARGSSSALGSSGESVSMSSLYREAETAAALTDGEVMMLYGFDRAEISGGGGCSLIR